MSNDTLTDGAVNEALRAAGLDFAAGNASVMDVKLGSEQA